MSPEPLPQTVQVTGQQGAFVARMLNRGYHLSLTPPALPRLRPPEVVARRQGAGGGAGVRLPQPGPARVRRAGGGAQPGDGGGRPAVQLLRKDRLRALAHRVPHEAGVHEEPGSHRVRLVEDGDVRS